MLENILVVSLVIFSLISGIYGFFLHRDKIFPYKSIKKLFYKILYRYQSDTGWSIGIITTQSPFNSSEIINIKKPSLSARDITDLPAASVADPFLAMANSGYFMFFEVIGKEAGKGVIGVAKSTDGKDWTYLQVVLDEPFHLSYPYIIKSRDDYYLIPESQEDFSVRIYKAREFPVKWEFQRKLLSGYRFSDPSIIFYNDSWWMFVSTWENDVLNLYYADHLLGPWIQHPESPISKNNKHESRPGGRLLEVDNKLYRLAQDDFPEYGSQVFAFEVIKLTRTSYSEKRAFEGPIIRGNHRGWNADGMHQLDAIKIADSHWLVAVDGMQKSKFKDLFQYDRGHK